MEIDLGRQLVADGFPLATVNGSGLRHGEKPYAAVKLNGDISGPELLLESADDCDRLIRVAVEAKRMLERAVIAHPFVPGPDPYRCAECGVTKGHHVEEPDDRYQLTATGQIEAAKPLEPIEAGESKLCEYCDVEPATEGRYCAECAPAVALAAARVTP